MFGNPKTLEEDKASYKLLLKGRKALSDSEVLSVIIGGSDEKSLEIAKAILTDIEGDLTKLTRLDLVALKRYNGIGEKNAMKMIAAFELSARREIAKANEKTKMSCSRDAFMLMKPVLYDSDYEEFHILILNRGNKILKQVRISEGGLSGTVADPKKIFSIALDAKGASIILVHNHPSGNTKPSESDIRLTQKLKKAGAFLDLPVIDHLVLANDSYFSFADEGLL